MSTQTFSRERAKPRSPRGGFSARTVDSLEAIPPGEWDALLRPASGPLSHGYLTAWEKSELAGLRSCPAVAYEPGSTQPMAACPGYFYELDLVGVRWPSAGGPLHVIRRAWPGFACPLTYELGSPTPLTNPFLVADQSLRGAAVKALITAAMEEGRRSGAQFLMVQNFASRTSPAQEELRRLGFAKVPTPPTAVVDLPFDSFEDYLGAMRAQYRRRARQTIKRSAGLRVEHLSDFSALADELAYLWRLIFDRAQEIKREILTPEYFRAVSALENSSVLLTRRDDGSIASFALLLADHPWLSFLQCGFDEPAGRAEGAYFRLLYEIIRVGIEGGFQQVELGLTTLQPKLDVGGVPVMLYAWVKHRNPVIQRLLQWLANGPMRPTELEPRRVFKTAPPSAEELVARRRLLG
jgi:predicted N-acyltransferase